MRPMHAPGVAAETIDDELALYAPGRSEAVILNRTAAEVWRLCDGSRTGEDIIRQLAELYDVSQDDIRAQVTATVDKLTAHGCLLADRSGP